MKRHLTTEDTGGAFALTERELDGGAAPATHDDDTWIYVLEGETDVVVGGDVIHAARDDLVTIPRGVEHEVRGAAARILAIGSPPAGAPPLPGPGVLRADEGERTKLGPMGVRFMIGSEETGGRFSLVEHPVDPLGLAAPVHTHGREDEWSYVLYGRLGAEIQGRALEAGPGELVAKGRGPHAFWNAIDAPTSMLEFIAPGGFERYFAEIPPILSSGEPDPEAIAAMMARYELTMDMSSIDRLVREHGLAGRRDDLDPR